MSIPKSSRRTGGPKSSAGKAVASKNAVKTGAYSRITVLPGEDEKEYEAIESRLQHDFQPADMAEIAIVQDIASLIWKQIRLKRLEQGAIIRVLQQSPTAEEILRHYDGPRDIDGDRLVAHVISIKDDWEVEAAQTRKEAKLAYDLIDHNAHVDQLESQCPRILRAVNEGFGVEPITAVESTSVESPFEATLAKVLANETPAQRLKAQWTFAAGRLIEFSDALLWLREIVRNCWLLSKWPVKNGSSMRWLVKASAVQMTISVVPCTVHWVNYGSIKVGVGRAQLR
jgi:hypothetical protein